MPYNTLRDLVAKERSEILSTTSNSDPAKFPQFKFSATNVISSLFLKPSDKVWLENVNTRTEIMDYVLYLGCNVLQTPHLMWTCMEVLKRMGVDFALVGGTSTCCGSPLLAAGKIEAAESFDRKRIEVFRKFHPKTVIEWDESCHQFTVLNTLRYNEPEFEMMNIEQFIAENIDHVPFTKPISKTAAIHDHYGPGLATAADFDAPRKALGSIPNIRLVDLPHSRESGLRCGFELLAHKGQKSDAELANKTLLQEARAAGVETLVTPWQACYRTLCTLGSEYDLEIKHLIQLIGESVGILGDRYEDKYRKYKAWGNVDKVLNDARENIEANGFSLDEIRPYVAKYLLADTSSFA